MYLGVVLLPTQMDRTIAEVNQKLRRADDGDKGVVTDEPVYPEKSPCQPSGRSRRQIEVVAWRDTSFLARKRAGTFRR